MMSKPLRAALAIAFVLAGALLFYIFLTTINESVAWAGPELKAKMIAQRVVLFVAGMGAMYAAFRVWRGSKAAAIYGGLGVIALVLFMSFLYVVAEGMRH
jgi:peptidoglycan/LPS O-acetylase OafA/YrhL